jgi:parallel beta-helix repeat protein
MKAAIVLGVCLCLGIAVNAGAQGRANSSRVLVVDDDGAQCHGAQFTTIQSAIDAASPGDSVHVCDGIYKETLHIAKNVDVVADSGAFLVPSSIPDNTASLQSGAPIAAAVLVTGTTGVRLFGLTVDGVNSGITGCAPNLIGVYYQNASGHAERLTVRGFQLGMGLGGCQSGTGIFVQSGNGGTSRVEIDHCVLHNFQKNGITANEVGTDVNIHGNVVNGIGVTTGAAQNGIQIGFGAQGAIRRNTVSNTLWSPCSTDNCANVGTGILVDQSDNVVIEANRVSHAQVGIFVVGNGSSLDANRVNDSQVFDGIRIQGDQNRVHGSRVNTSGEAGIFLQGANDRAVENIITEAPIGILKTSDSTGAHIQNNTFFSTPVTVQDPPVVDLAGKLSPVR